VGFVGTLQFLFFDYLSNAMLFNEISGSIVALIGCSAISLTYAGFVELAMQTLISYMLSLCLRCKHRFMTIFINCAMQALILCRRSLILRFKH